jgi:hypothetical protein
MRTSTFVFPLSLGPETQGRPSSFVFGLFVHALVLSTLLALLAACIRDGPGPPPAPTVVALAGTPTPTPTVTPICPSAVTSDTTWGPGTVRVNCSVGVTTGVTLTIAPATQVLFLGHHKLDVKGRLYAVGTVTEPVTLTHETGVVTDSWGYVYLRGPTTSTLHYANVYYGSGINDAAGSALRCCTLMTNTYGLALLGPAASDVASCTVQYNDVGVLLYGGASPAVQYSNILSNTVYDVQVQQRESAAIPDCWWGSDPPDDGTVWDTHDDFTLGALDRTPYASGWVSW